jgi:hypothetical protein
VKNDCPTKNAFQNNHIPIKYYCDNYFYINNIFNQSKPTLLTNINLSFQGLIQAQPIASIGSQK